jgi:hypothetical protein
MINPIFSFIALAAKRAKANLERKTYNVGATQEAFLRSLLQVQQHTELGQYLGLDQITTVDEFRQRVPVLPYSAYEPYIERAAAGEQNVVTPDPLIYLNLTSGSTGNQKMIPVTRRSRRAIGRANQAAMGFLVDAAQRRGLPLGKMLLTGSAQKVGRTSGGIDYGHISGGSLRLAGPLYRQIFAHPYNALLVSNHHARNYVLLLFALRNPHLAMLAATFPLIALQLCNDLERFGESLVEDLARGRMTDQIEIEPFLRAQLEQQLKPAPARARQLRRILQTNARLTPQTVWPDLSFIITARGGTSDFYFERFGEYFGDTPVFGGTYASAESTYGVHRDFNTDGTILALDSGFFEFIPSNQWEQEQPQTVLPQELQVGERYRILVTNYAGFCRYDIGDVVEVEGFYNQAPLIMFRFRQGGILCATTEKTTEYHATQVVRSLQQDFNLQLEDFCITLSESLLHPHYVLNIELAPGERLEPAETFLASFDQHMQRSNRSYGIKRANQDIPAPELRILAAGSFAQLRQQSAKIKLESSQLKFPHISSDRTLLAQANIEQVTVFPPHLEKTPLLL